MLYLWSGPTVRPFGAYLRYVPLPTVHTYLSVGMSLPTHTLATMHATHANACPMHLIPVARCASIDLGPNGPEGPIGPKSASRLAKQAYVHYLLCKLRAQRPLLAKLKLFSWSGFLKVGRRDNTARGVVPTCASSWQLKLLFKVGCLLNMCEWYLQ